MPKRYICCFLTLFITALSFSQVNSPGGVTCDMAGPICSDNTGNFVFENNNDSSTNINTDIACLGTPPRPSWFFLRVGQTGNLEFEIVQTSNGGAGIDVDFVVWGPFASPDGNCNNINTNCPTCPDNVQNPNYYPNDLDNSNIVDCSWSLASIESMTLPNANAGEYYLLLVSNWGGGEGVIEINQTNFGTPSGGSTDCSIINVDGILGPDQSVCGAQSIILDANPNNDPDFVGYDWQYDEGTGFVPIPGTDGLSSISVSDEGLYSVTITDINGDSDTDVMEYIIDDIPTANPVNSQIICDDDNDGFWAFDLASLEPIILGGQSSADFDITFHANLNDAQMNMAPLSSPYTNQVAYQDETIFVRIENIANTDCYSTGSFLIDVFNQPTANTSVFELCDNANDGNDTNGFVEFNLSAYNGLVLGTQDPMEYNVSYHDNQTDADNNASPLANLYTNATALSEQIVVRVENNMEPSCFITALVTLQVNALPTITNTVELRQCDNDADGISDFNLTEANTLISTNAASETFTFYTNNADADMAMNEIVNPTAYTNTDASANPDILFVRVENADGCYRLAQLELFVSASQIPNGYNILYEACDDDTVDGDNTNGVTTFDFSDATPQITALFAAGQDIKVTYYENEADALAEQNAIPDISNHRNDASPFTQNIYVRVDNNTDNSCSGLGQHITLTTINPMPNLDPDDLILCDDVTVGNLQEVFDLTVNEAYIFNGDPNVFATYYLTANDAEMGINMIANPTAYTNTNPTETIFVRVENSNSGCYARVDFDVTVNPLPDATLTVTDFPVCENNTDFVFPFDLESKTTEILNGQDPNEFTVTYHASQEDAEDLTNALVSPYNNTSNPQQIFVAITNNITGCSVSTLNFNIEVIEGAEANSDGEPLLYEICDNIGDNDGFGQFDLTTLDAEVFDGQDPMEFSLTYHDSMDDALNNVEPLPTTYENTSVNGNPSNPQVIYARVSNNLDPQACFEIAEITLQVNLLPIFDLEDRYVLCRNINGSEVVDVPPVIDTQLSDTDYSFEWSLNGTVLPAETSSSLIPTQGGTYSVVVTDTSTSVVTMCSSTDSTEVIESEPPVVTAEVTSNAFSGNNMIEATATGSSIYEYSLDNGPWQDNGSFEDVSSGEHLVLARDINGCGIGTATVLVIDYPKYFTPNGDGNHESWNIVGIDTQPFAKVYIFDRYGKLIKQLDPQGPGWDGTYRGNIMPTSDYWFKVEYDEPRTGERKEFTAHFSLKR